MNVCNAAETIYILFAPRAIYEKDPNYKNATDDTAEKQVLKKHRDTFIAYRLLEGVDFKRYGNMAKELARDFTKGQKTFSSTPEEALELITARWCRPKGNN